MPIKLPRRNIPTRWSARAPGVAARAARPGKRGEPQRGACQHHSPGLGGAGPSVRKSGAGSAWSAECRRSKGGGRAGAASAGKSRSRGVGRMCSTESAARSTCSQGASPSPVMRRTAHCACRATRCRRQGKTPKPPSRGEPRRRGKDTPAKPLRPSGGNLRSTRRAVAWSMAWVTAIGGRAANSAWYRMREAPYAELAMPRPKTVRGNLEIRSKESKSLDLVASQSRVPAPAEVMSIPRQRALDTIRRPCQGEEGAGRGRPRGRRKVLSRLRA